LTIEGTLLSQKDAFATAMKALKEVALLFHCFAPHFGFSDGCLCVPCACVACVCGVQNKTLMCLRLGEIELDHARLL
jgi:hypothetical protein